MSVLRKIPKYWNGSVALTLAIATAVVMSGMSVGLAQFHLFKRGRGAATEATAPAGPVAEDEARAIATEAYIYGYPLVTMDMTRRIMTNVPAPTGMKAPMGQFAQAREYPPASFRDVTAPNADTLYSVAWLDLGKEPWILHVPDEDGRYYLMPMLSGWTNVFADPGTRTTGTKAGDFAITGPGWNGTLPQGVRRYASPTNMVWILGRTYCTGTPEDYRAVHTIQDKYSVVPLSSWGKPYTPPRDVPIDATLDMKTPVRNQVNAMDAGAFFNTLARLMKDNPPPAPTRRWLPKWPDSASFLARASTSASSIRRWPRR